MRILIKQAYAVFQERTKILQNADVAIEHGKIVSVGESLDGFNPEVTIDGRGRKLLVVPGIMNSHIHTDETLYMNVIPDSAKHIPWFRDWTLPYYHAINREDLYWSTLLSCMLMLESGTTCYSDSANVEPYLAADAATKSGIRGFVAKWTSDIGDDFSMPTDDCIRENEELLKINRRKGRVKAIASVIGINRTSNSLYTAIKELALKNNTIVTSHEASGVEDVKLCLKRTGKRPIENLYSIGFLSERTLISHLTVITEREASLVSKTGTAVVTCPTAELKKGKGFTRQGKLHRLIKDGVRICVGTDTSNSSNHLNVVRAGTLASLIAKDVSQDPGIADVGTVLSWLTETPYSIFGIKGGKIRRGYVADVSVFELELGFYSKGVLQELFYGNNQKCIATIVDGELAYCEGKFKKFKREDVLQECVSRAERIHRRLSL